MAALLGAAGMSRKSSKNITTLELHVIPIITAATIWGKYWQGQTVQCRCDNQAAVHALLNRSCKDPNLMHLLHTLFFEAHFHISLHTEHKAGKDN